MAVYFVFFTVKMSSPPSQKGLLSRSMSGNTLTSHTNATRRNEQAANSGPSMGNAAYRASLVSHYAEDLDRRRRAERAIEESRTERRHPFLNLLINDSIRFNDECVFSFSTKMTNSSIRLPQSRHGRDVLARQRSRASYRPLRVGSRQRLVMRLASWSAVLHRSTDEGAQL